MNIGKAIRVVRAARGFTQTELAERAGYDASYVSLVEAGNREPARDTVRKLAGALSVPAHFLQLLATDAREYEAMPREQQDVIARQLLALVMEADA